MLNKKGQVEIVGMLIVVILIVFVIFIVIRFQSDAKPPEISKTYMSDQMSTSFILAFLDTGTECVNHASFRDVIADCASGQEKLDCSGYSSCDYLTDTIPDVLNNTLDLWGVSYRFNISHPTLDPSFVWDTCDPLANIDKHSFQRIPMWPNPNSVRVGIDICSN
jgi:hypothetical protein